MPLRSYLDFATGNAIAEKPESLGGFGPQDLNQLLLESKGRWKTNAMRYVGNLTSLEALRVDNAFIEDEAVNDLNKLPHLRNLAVRYSQISGKSLAQLKTLQQLNEIELSGLDEVSAVIKGLSGSQNIELLMVNDCELSDNDLKPVATMPNLQNLDMSHNHDITDSTMEAISNLHHLKNLSIQETSITPTSLPNIRKLTALEVLTRQLGQKGHGGSEKNDTPKSTWSRRP